MKMAAVARLPQDRTTRRYQALLKWCEWLLNMSSPTMSAGTADAPGLLFDMNKLFEAYVTRLEETASDDHQYVHSQKPQMTLATLQGAGVFTLKPDITVWQTEPGQEAPRITRIVDAKWRRLSPLNPNWGVDQGDIYQMLAYAIRYKCNHMKLYYPAPDGTISQWQDLPVYRIDVGMIPSELSGSTSEQLRSGEHRDSYPSQLVSGQLSASRFKKVW